MNLTHNVAQWVADLMKADGVTPAILAEMSEADQVALSLAYLDAVGKKITHIQNTYMTRHGAAAAMQSHILSAL